MLYYIKDLKILLHVHTEPTIYLTVFACMYTCICVWKKSGDKENFLLLSLLVYSILNAINNLNIFICFVYIAVIDWV